MLIVPFVATWINVFEKLLVPDEPLLILNGCVRWVYLKKLKKFGAKIWRLILEQQIH